MKYTYKEGVKIKDSSKKRWIILPAFLLLAGGYGLINSFWPAIPASVIEGDAVASKLTSQQPSAGDNRVYIPQIGVDISLTEDGDSETLSGNAMHRSPESGNPDEGGNFVVVSSGFRLGLTPDQTRKNSPFYHIDKLNVGDQFYVDYSGKRYAYEIESKKRMSDSTADIETRTDDPILTMYAVSDAGPDSERKAIVARPIGTVAWVNGQPKLKSL